MRRPDNPYFAKAIVNRVWAHYFGRGIIDPPDNLSSFNPATHPELLKELCDGFIQNKYDLRWLHRTIANSRTYQQSSIATKENEADKANYAYFPMRRLGAEVFLDALNTPLLHQPGYGLWNGTVSYTDTAENWTVSVGAKNIFNKRFLVAGYADVGASGFVEGVYNRGREWQIEVRRKF